MPIKICRLAGTEWRWDNRIRGYVGERLKIVNFDAIESEQCDFG